MLFNSVESRKTLLSEMVVKFYSFLSFHRYEGHRCWINYMKSLLNDVYPLSKKCCFFPHTGDCWMSSPSPQKSQAPKFRTYPVEHFVSTRYGLDGTSAKVLFAYSDYTNSFILPDHPLLVHWCTQKKRAHNSMFRFIPFPWEKWVVSESVRPRVFVGICWESQSGRHGRASLFMKN